MIRPTRLAASSLFATLLLLGPAPASAVPMPPGTVTLHNPDGTTVAARLKGDEFHSWAEDLDGYPLVLDKADGAWHYARVAKDGRLTALRARPGKADPRLLKLSRLAKPTRAQLDRALQRRLKLHPGGAATRARTSGTVEMLTVLAQFQCPATGPDCVSSNMTPTFQPADFDAVFNGASGSIRDYYSVASGHALSMHTTVYPAWIQLAHNDAYYAYNEYVTDGHPEEMLTEVIAYLDSVNFDFAPYADAAGVIDAIGIIHIGKGYEESLNEAVIHSHQMRLGSPITTKGGQKIYGYHTEPEVRAGKITPIGVIAHEMGHGLGLPDLYDTSYASAGLGLFSVMAAGSYGGPNDDCSVPVLPDAWSRIYLGWATPRRLTASATGNHLTPNPTDVVKLPSGLPPAEYFLLENRAQAGYDQYLPAAGLAVYHVDDAMADNTPPSVEDHYRVALEEADGDQLLQDDPDYLGGPNDLYPATTPANAQFTASSTPASVGYGLASSQIGVTNIARAAPDITFDLAIVVSGKLADGFTCLAAAECLNNHCADGVCCNAACDIGVCDACSRAMGAKVDGTCELVTISCNDGDPCTEGDACSQGVCAGVPKVCPKLDSCHQVSVCQADGTCSNVPFVDNTACDDEDDCTTGDHCLAGVCVGTAITECPAPDQCHVAAACSDKKCGKFGVKNDNTPCDDQSRCTTGDACLRGACVGTPVACVAPNDCYTQAACVEATGTCPAAVARPEGASCDDKNACTKDDACAAGACKGVVDPTVTTCPAPDQCHADGLCSATGECLADALADGTACDNGDKCIRNQKCISGACTGTAIVCTSNDPCYDYSCVATTGMCALKAKAEGSSCVSEDPCEVDATCRQGVCKGDPMECPAADECHTGGTCNSMDGKCKGATAAVDGKRCTGGTCFGGVCVLDPVDAGEPIAAADAGSGNGKGGCGCSTPGAAPLSLLALAAVLPLRRRRS